MHNYGILLSVQLTLSVTQIVGKHINEHPLILRFAGYFRVTMNFSKFDGPSMCEQFGSVGIMIQNYGFNSSDREAIWEVRSTSNGREATVTERAARFKPDTFFNGKGDRRPPKGLIHPQVDRI